MQELTTSMMTKQEAAITPAAGIHSGMKKGFYNQNSTTQRIAAGLCKELLVTAAEQVLLPDHSRANSRQLHVAEWGCAHGANSIEPICLLADILARRCQEQAGTQQQLQVHVTHVDVPNNDWPALFSCTHQYEEQIHQAHPSVQVTSAAIGKSMYERNFPSGSLDLGFSFSTLHWQSKKACILKHSINPGGIKTLPEEHELLTAHAISDLKQFLQLRASEFKQGGLLVVMYVAYSKELPLSSMLYHDAAQAVADSMVSEGLLQPQEPGLMAASVYFLDEQIQRDEVYAAVAGTWELLHLDTVNNVSRSWVDYQEGRATKEEQAAVFVNFWKAVMEPSMIAGLQQSGRQEKEIPKLLDTFFQRMTAAAVANPLPASYPAIRVLLRRV